MGNQAEKTEKFLFGTENLKVGKLKAEMKKNFDNFYEFMNAPYKYEKICCICFCDENNVLFDKSKIEEEYNDVIFHYEYNNWKTELFSKIENDTLSSIKDYIFQKGKNNCKHFYHETCKGTNFECLFCKYGFSIENAYNFGLMKKEDLRHIIEYYKKIVDRIIYVIDYTSELLKNVYDSIYESSKISDEKKNKIKELKILENKFIEKNFKKKDFEIPLTDSVTDWKDKYNQLIEEKRQKNNRMKEKNNYSENTSSNSSYSSSDSKYKPSMAIQVCEYCSKSCFFCGKKGRNQGSIVRVHQSCNDKDNIKRKICGKCGEKIKNGSSRDATYCTNCHLKGKYKIQTCHFCKEKL